MDIQNMALKNKKHHHNLTMISEITSKNMCKPFTTQVQHFNINHNLNVTIVYFYTLDRKRK